MLLQMDEAGSNGGGPAVKDCVVKKILHQSYGLVQTHERVEGRGGQCVSASHSRRDGVPLTELSSQ